MSMAALTKNAALSAIVLSIKLNFSAFFILALSSPILRVCTNALCKYKLWGITVAPIIPMAIYRASLFKCVGIKPVATAAKFGFADITSAAITITPPGSTVAGISVAASGCTRIYENTDFKSTMASHGIAQFLVLDLARLRG